MRTAVIAACALLLTHVLAASASKHVLFVLIAGHTPNTYLAATAAELLRTAGEGEVTVRYVTYSKDQAVVERYLDPSTQIRYFSFKDSWETSLSRKAQINLATGESNLKGIPQLLGELASFYEQEHHELLEEIKHQKPDLIVADFFAFSATDLAEHLGIPHMTFYHVGAFGVLGIEDSLAYPEFLEGTNLAQQSLSTRIFKIFQFLRVVVATSDGTAVMNKARAKLGLKQYNDPQTNTIRHPMIATTFFGFEYPHPVSPLTRLVGAYTTQPLDPASFPEGSSDAIAHAWLSASDKPVVFASFGTEAFPLLSHFEAVVNGGLAAGMRVLMLARQDVLTYYKLKPEDLRPASASDSDVLVLPWLSTPRTLMDHPAVAAFICHGGIQSITEAITAGIPLVMLPAGADRYATTARIVDRGLAVKLDQYTLTAHNVTQAIQEVTQPARAASIKAKMAWMRKLNAYAGNGDVGAAQYICEVLDVGYDHLVPITLDLNPLAAAGGLDAVAVVLGGVLVMLYVVVRVLLMLLGCGKSGKRRSAKVKPE